MKRFYRTAAVLPDESGFLVALDGRPVKTPARAPLALPGEALASAIAAEWEVQKDKIQPETMPLTSLATTAIDLIRPARAATICELLAFAEGDTLLYHAPAPEKLVLRQQELWEPILCWCRARFDIELYPTRSTLALTLPTESLQRFEAALSALSEFHLSALATGARAGASLLLALALYERRIGADEAFAASELEALYNRDLWGVNPEAEKRFAAIRADFAAAAQFFTYLEEPGIRGGQDDAGNTRRA